MQVYITVYIEIFKCIIFCKGSKPDNQYDNQIKFVGVNVFAIILHGFHHGRHFYKISCQLSLMWPDPDSSRGNSLILQVITLLCKIGSGHNKLDF